MCQWGMWPPVPPFSLGRPQLDTRVRCTPTIRDTAVGPPSLPTMVFAGSTAGDHSEFRYVCKPIVENSATDCVAISR